MIGPGKHGEEALKVIVQKELNIHIYFRPWQSIWGSKIEAGPIQDIKAGVTHAWKGGLKRIHT